MLFGLLIASAEADVQQSTIDRTACIQGLVDHRPHTSYTRAKLTEMFASISDETLSALTKCIHDAPTQDVKLPKFQRINENYGTMSFVSSTNKKIFVEKFLTAFEKLPVDKREMALSRIFALSLRACLPGLESCIETLNYSPEQWDAVVSSIQETQER